jgi:hypothetical protein
MKGRKKMSKADRTFEKLGYVKIERKGYISYFYEGDRSNWIKFRLEVEGEYKPFRKQVKSNMYLTMQELQAINKKCKELEWI